MSGPNGVVGGRRTDETCPVVGDQHLASGAVISASWAAKAAVMRLDPVGGSLDAVGATKVS